MEVLQDNDFSSIGKCVKEGSFHFEEAWAREPDFIDIVSNHWKEKWSIVSME